MNKCVERLHNGIIKENPVFVLVLGICPTLAVTSTMMNGIGMGLTTTVVLTCSNILVSLLRKVIPDRVRMPAYIVIVASFVTLVQFWLQAYLPSLNASLGIYIPLIVVNCIILGRAESYASKNDVVSSLFDGLGMGLGFTVALTFLGFFRELIGSGTILSHTVIPEEYSIKVIALAPGAFFVLAALIAVRNKIMMSHGKDPDATGCMADCKNCLKDCDNRLKEFEEEKAKETEVAE